MADYFATRGIFTGFTDRAAPQLGGLTALTGSTVLLALTGSRRLLYTLVMASLALGNILFLFLPKHGDTSPAEKKTLAVSAARTDAQKQADAAAGKGTKKTVSLWAVPKLLLSSDTIRKVSLCYLAVVRL